jgi:hypothetical protein
MNRLTHAPYDISKVVYLELLDKNNFPLKQLKIKTDALSGYSDFVLPDNISSGNYVIRAYTSWMKNLPPKNFFYKTISVINPFESIDHLELNSNANVSDTVNSILSPEVSDEKSQSAAGSVSMESKGQINYSISLHKPDYSVREKVLMEITATDMAGNPVESDISVSVAKSVAINSAWQIKSTGFGSGNSVSVPGNTANATFIAPVYLPEIEDHLICGSIRMKETNEPLKNIDLSLSWVGKAARCQFCRSDNNGEFRFVSDQNGLKEIVIQPLSSDLTGYFIELNQPYYNSFSNYTPEVFYLDSARLVAINNIVISMQVNNIYEEVRPKPEEEKLTVGSDFYGKPENSIKMSDYIELTTVREVVKEIIPNVYTLRQNGKYDFKLINKYRGQPFENKPLVLIDGVPVYDFEKVLNISSKEIERADITNTRYFYSEIVFDGILSFITKKGNLSCLEFDNSVFRQVYETYNEDSEFYSPDYSSVEMKDSRIPDFRNTLLWEPALHTSRNGKAEIEFFTSDESSEYTIVVEGISTDGRSGFSTSSLFIK